MDDLKYLLNGSESIEETSTEICRCQFEVCSPKSALEKLFLLTMNESGISISNVSDSDKFVLLKIQPKSIITVDTAKRIELFKDKIETDLKNPVIIVREDDPLWDDSEWL